MKAEPGRTSTYTVTRTPPNPPICTKYMTVCRNRIQFQLEYLWTTERIRICMLKTAKENYLNYQGFTTDFFLFCQIR